LRFPMLQTVELYDNNLSIKYYSFKLKAGTIIAKYLTMKPLY
jgi:hypothetical protein